MNQQGNPETACDGKINDASLYPIAAYKGKTVYFCNEAYRQISYADPDRFIAGEI